MEGLQQRANEGEPFPRSMGVSASGKAAHAGARRLKSPAYPQLEPVDASVPTGSVGCSTRTTHHGNRVALKAVAILLSM